ncbi:hypothetical protein BD560DRAFT_175641 [Blakeslea trispora]|nr:hypothetical protein BD560DRAFT_175641 [Blakeslea trispora]
MNSSYFSRENLRNINLNEFDRLYKQQNANTDRRQAHEAFAKLLSQMNEESFDEEEEKEFKRLQDELTNCNKNDGNKKIWVEDVAEKREREENAGEEQKESKKQRSNEEGSLTLSADMATATDAVADEVEDIEDGKWIVDGYDISSRFDNLRQTALSNKAAKKLTCLDKLHLNHVFFVSKTMQKSTLRFFPLAVKKSIVSASFGAAECSLPLEVKAWIEEFEEVITTVPDNNESVLKIADKEQKRMKQKARTFAQEAEEKEDPALEVYAEVFGCA